MSNELLLKTLKTEIGHIAPNAAIKTNQALTKIYVDLSKVEDKNTKSRMSALADRDSRITWEGFGRDGVFHLLPAAKTAREVYAEANEAGQMEMDLGWLRMGGHLSEEKMDRLVEAGLIGPWR